MSHYRTIASIYNPDLLTKAQLINNFVVRIKKFEKIMADLRSATMEKPEQPIMLVGMRGMGKTTLLRRIAYEVESDPKLSQWLLPVVFSEEEYGITTLFKLWETIAEYLARQAPVFEGLYERLDAEHRRDGDRHRYELRAFQLLTEALHAQNKKMLLVIDNFGDIFKRFNKQEKQRLREVLMTCPDLRIIAGSALIIDAFFRYDDPLHEFFQVERLDGLNREETELLLLKLGEHLPDHPVKTIIEHQPQRVEALRRVTGGNPRSIVFLFEIFVNDREGTAFTDLESILDRVTPLYKHRMDDLPAQQQEILQALALHYDGMSAREVAERTRLDSRLVSAQLRQLEQAELVQTITTHNKNHLYCVRDRFFNIWFLMRMARKSDRNRVLWLVRFLECWCDSDQLSKRSDAHRKALYLYNSPKSEIIPKENLSMVTEASVGDVPAYTPKSMVKIEFNDAFYHIVEQSEGPSQIKYLALALAKNQYTFLYDYFTSEKGIALHTRERFTPIWYALMYYMQDTYPSEYLRMPPELEETVQEIISRVEDYREAYKLEE